jgi:Phage Tail Collar Domain
MPTLFYKDPNVGDWIPFGTNDPAIDEVRVTDVEPTDAEADLWVEPSGTGNDVSWPEYDARYISKDGDTMRGPLFMAANPVSNMEAATKEYVDTTTMILSNSMQAAHMPVGSITLFAGNYLPPGWHRCDGSAHNSWALEAALGSPNSPNLMGRQGLSYIIYGGP